MLIALLSLMLTTKPAPPPPPPAYPPDVVADVVIHDILTYTRSEAAGAIVRLVVANEAQHAAEAAQEAQRAAEAQEAAQGHDPVTAPQATSGDCYSGTPIPAFIITRESGGDPNAVNPSSGALGCYQLMPEHFASGGACAGLGTDIAGQKACAIRLYDAAGLSPWAL